jgi:hypothetical protein
LPQISTDIFYLATDPHRQTQTKDIYLAADVRRPRLN